MPPEGMLLAKRFPPEEIKRRYDSLRVMGAPLGIIFGEVAVTPNSRLALEASEFARDNGRFDSFHEKVFYAYFTECRDIGKLDEILKLAAEEGLDSDELRRAVGEGRYADRLRRARKEASELGITAVPTFLIEGGDKIVGVQPIDFFRERLRRNLK